jgi:hypothetical protein
MLEGLTPPRLKTVYCKVDEWLKKLDESDRKILQEALNNFELWPHSTLARALRAKGLDISDTTIGKHRNKDCACYKD